MKTKLMLVAAMTLCVALGYLTAPRQNAYAASSNCVVTTLEATLEADSSVATATVANQVTKGGYIVNGGSNAVFVNFMGNGVIAGTNTQNNSGEIEMPAGATVPVRPSCRAFSYKAASSTSVLYWFPSE